MFLLDLTLPTPAENLALDEALLEEAEQSTGPRETLRLWESAATMVVIGRSSRIAEEVDLAACRRRGIPVLRRSSGGAAIVTGPGCLMYALVLSYDLRPELRSIDLAHRLVLGKLAAAVSPDAGHCGTSDLAIDGRKFSGNSVRCRRGHLLYHGTLLYDFAIETIVDCLRAPPRQPDYRRGRAHGQFVTNLASGARDLRRAVVEAWGARVPLAEWPRDATARLVAERYGCDQWHHER
jgi:lipoate-protein ligase A